MQPRARFAAAALAALALAAAGCDLISSLTPFGLETRGPDPSAGTYSGSWLGTTGSGGEVSFTVVSGQVVGLVLNHTLACGLELTLPFPEALLIVDAAFSDEIALDPQGKADLAGRFTSPDTVAGAFTFESLAVSPQCPTFGAGSFTANKVPPTTP